MIVGQQNFVSDLKILTSYASNMEKVRNIIYIYLKVKKKINYYSKI